MAKLRLGLLLILQAGPIAVAAAAGQESVVVVTPARQPGLVEADGAVADGGVMGGGERHALEVYKGVCFDSVRVELGLTGYWWEGF